MRRRRMLRAAAVVIAAAALAGCAGLPTSGPIGNGLPVGEGQQGTEFLTLPSGPIAGASPDQIVSGFLEAAISPGNEWSIAQEFLDPELASTWQPGAGVTIDTTASSRRFDSDDEDAAEDVDETSVHVGVDQIASIDATGAYSEAATGATDLQFRLARDDDDEWRITEAPDGIVLDRSSFQQVFDPYALKYFDRSWSHLVPDLRWYPRRTNVATRITRTIVESGASEWLRPGVQSAFPADIGLAKAAVPVDGQVAEVELDRGALSLDAEALARMRTQLQESLAPLGISEVRLSVEGRVLDAGTVELAAPEVDTSTVVVTDQGLGSLSGGELSPVSGIGDQLAEIAQPLRSVDMAQGGDFAAVQLDDGSVYVVSPNGRDELGRDDVEPPADRIRPAVDPYGFIWTVSASEPQTVVAWTAGVVPGSIADAWPEADSITALRVSSDGARVAAILTVGGHRSVVVAAVVRDEQGMPTGLGPVHELTDLPADAPTDLAWSGTDAVVVLIGGEDGTILTQPVGGPGTSIAAPAGSIALSGADRRTGIRVLGEDGVLYAPRASVWQEYYRDVLLLGTRAGY